jgi:localization factor PodJL
MSVSWSVEGIDPTVRERAEAAARRAGMSLNDWLNSTIGDSAPPNFRARPNLRPSPQAPAVADIHQRLDAITRQIEQISRPGLRSEALPGDARGEAVVARQLNDAISRLDARLSQISNPAPAQQALLQNQQRQAELVERAAAQVYRPSPPLSPSLDFAIAEIAARQSELDNTAPRPMAPRSAPPMAPEMAPAAPPPPPGPDFSSLERHLFKITSQIEALQRPDGIEQSIAAFRVELTEIRQAITEAMPRRAIESIETEILSLSRRIDDTRQSGIDDQALAGIESALGEIREVLGTLTPAEQLTGYDDAIRNLGAKLDLILRASDDPSTVRQLESAIAALRSIVSNIASNDALVRLSDDVHTLSSKVDQLTRSGNNNDAFAVLEQRIAALTSTLESRERPPASENSEQLEGALRNLSDRLDRLPVGNDDASTFAHLEQRVSYLLERLEAATDHRGDNLGRVEDGLQDILRHLESQNANFVALTESSQRSAEPVDSGLADIVKRELSDIRFSQSEAGRHTQDSLEAVHNTLGHVVDRLAMIEGDLRSVRSQPVTLEPVALQQVALQPVAPEPVELEPLVLEPATPPAPAPLQAPPPPVPLQALRIELPPQPKPELPNPAAADGPFAAAEPFAAVGGSFAASQEHFASAPREFQTVQVPMPAVAAITSKAVSEMLGPYGSPRATVVAPELPPDHPLEPGTRPSGRAPSPSERIAASESAISEIAPNTREQASTSDFIAAARRAAQAAAAAQVNDKTARSPAKKPAGDKPKQASAITSKIRALLVGASVVVIVLGTFKMAMTLLDGGSAPTVPATESSSEQTAPTAQPPADDRALPALPAQPAPMMPSLTSPTPIGRQSFNAAPPDTSPIPAATAAPSASQVTASDITGAIPAVATVTAPSSGRKLSIVQVPPTERLPEAIGGPALRAAALKGDPSAAYEIGLRFAEGKGVAPNYDEAAKWYDRAARAGVVPAIFRLGTLYEKGLSVKKDVDIARRYYSQAAERGNAKAMHNLAVLDADGGGQGANYKNASQWFRKAAEHGVADSQFNLGILYARGIGVEQNLAESFKWFSLAAAQGDADALRKRDDIAKRLDAQSLAAAKLAIQTFTPEPQPDDAVNVTGPAGGWDATPAQANTAKPAAKPVLTKRAAAAH